MKKKAWWHLPNQGETVSRKKIGIIALLTLTVISAIAMPTVRSAPLMSPAIEVGSFGEYPAAAYNPISNQYLVVWKADSQGLRGRFVRDGWTMGNEFDITGAFLLDGSPQVAFDPSRMRYLVVWNRGGYGGHMYGRFIPWSGPDPSLTEFVICPTVPVYVEGEYSIAYSSAQDEFFVVWVTRFTTPSTYFPTVGRRVRADGGGFVGTTFFVADHPPDNRSHADVAYNSARNEYLVSTHDYPKVDDNIYGVRVTGAGAVQSEVTIAGWPDEEAMPAVAAASPADQYMVVWDSIRISPLSRGVYARFIAGDGTPGAVKQIVHWDSYNNEYTLPVIAWGMTDLLLDDPRYLIVYRPQSVYDRLSAREIFLNGTMYDSFEISGAYSGDRHAVAGGRTNFLVAWHSIGIQALFVGNTMPKACFSVDPAVGSINTAFMFDASCSTDATQAGSELQVRWDWNGDDMYETTWSYTKTVSHSFSLPPGQSSGVFSVRMQVTDGDGGTDTVTNYVTVYRGPFSWLMFLPAIIKNAQP